MTLPGYNCAVSFATAATGVTYSEMDGVISFTLSDGTDMLDTTCFKDTRLRQRIAGLRDLSASLEGDLESADTGFAKAKATYRAGVAGYVKILPDGTNGIVVPVLVESIETNASVDGKVEVSISLQLEGNIDPFDIGTG